MFQGDDNKLVMDIQHNAYSQLVGMIFHHAAMRFVQAAELVEFRNPLVVKLESIKVFDHRVLQNAHDYIAAWFRYSVPDASQLPLFGEAGIDSKDFIERRWIDFFKSEIDSLVRESAFVRAVIKAVVHANKDEGRVAERTITKLLTFRYSGREWMRPRSYARFDDEDGE